MEAEKGSSEIKEELNGQRKGKNNYKKLKSKYERKGKKRNFRLKNTSTKTKIMFQNSIKTKEETEKLKHFILWAEI